MQRNRLLSNVSIADESRQRNIPRCVKNVDLLIGDNEYTALRLFENTLTRCITGPINYHLRQNGVFISNLPVNKKQMIHLTRWDEQQAYDIPCEI